MLAILIIKKSEVIIKLIEMIPAHQLRKERLAKAKCITKELTNYRKQKKVSITLFKSNNEKAWENLPINNYLMRCQTSMKEN